MKRLFQSVFAVLVIACIITSCSKKSDNITKDPNITTQELQDYYIISIFTDKGVQKLGVIYFVKDGSGMTAILDGNGLRRQLPVTFANNLFVFDANSNGSAVFAFTLKRETNGHAGLDSYSFKRTGDSQSKLDYAEMIKVSDAPAFDGKVFTYSLPLTTNETHLRFEAGNKWKYDDPSGSTSLYSYYAIGNGIGWKCEDAASGGTSMGVMVPKWTGNGPTMLLETTISRLDAAHIHNAVRN
jgi:hypothetical protein